MDHKFEEISNLDIEPYDENLVTLDQKEDKNHLKDSGDSCELDNIPTNHKKTIDTTEKKKKITSKDCLLKKGTLQIHNTLNENIDLFGLTKHNNIFELRNPSSNKVDELPFQSAKIEESLSQKSQNASVNESSTKKYSNKTSR